MEPHDNSNLPPQSTLPQQQTLPTPPSAPSPPQLWLGPGPYLARRTWQQKTRTLITALTGLSGVLWIIIAFLAIALGALVTATAKDDTFDGKGELPFGLCEGCADEAQGRCPTCPWIPASRLDAIPHARLCVQMKEREERNR